MNCAVGSNPICPIGVVHLLVKINLRLSANYFCVALCFYGSSEEILPQLKSGVRRKPDSPKWVRVTKSLGNPGLRDMP